MKLFAIFSLIFTSKSIHIVLNKLLEQYWYYNNIDASITDWQKELNPKSNILQFAYWNIFALAEHLTQEIKRENQLLLPIQLPTGRA